MTTYKKTKKKRLTQAESRARNEKIRKSNARRVRNKSKANKVSAHNSRRS